MIYLYERNIEITWFLRRIQGKTLSDVTFVVNDARLMDTEDESRGTVTCTNSDVQKAHIQALLINWRGLSKDCGGGARLLLLYYEGFNIEDWGVYAAWQPSIRHALSPQTRCPSPLAQSRVSLASISISIHVFYNRIYGSAIIVIAYKKS